MLRCSSADKDLYWMHGVLGSIPSTAYKDKQNKGAWWDTPAIQDLGGSSSFLAEQWLLRPHRLCLKQTNKTKQTIKEKTVKKNPLENFNTKGLIPRNYFPCVKHSVNMTLTFTHVTPTPTPADFTVHSINCGLEITGENLCICGWWYSSVGKVLALHE